MHGASASAAPLLIPLRGPPPPPVSPATLGTESFGLRRRRRAAAMADVVVAAADSARSTTTTPTSTRQQQLRPVDDDDASDDHHQDVASTQRQTRSARAFPPPISVIGGSGRPWLRLRAHREGGRLVLREMLLPSQEMLRPCKEGGRFKLLVHPAGAAGTAAREGR